MRLNSSSPSWTPSARHTAIIIILLLVTLILWRFREFLEPLAWAILISYILDPLVELLDRRTPLNRSVTVILILVALITAFAVSIAAFSNPLGDQIRALQNLLPGYIEQVTERIDQPLPVFGANLQLGTLLESASTQIGSALSGFAGQTLQVAVSVVAVIGQFVIVIVVAVYLLVDFRKFLRSLGGIVPEPYRGDFRHIAEELSRVWGGYLRGKVILALVMGLLTGSALAILGVRNALLLGVLAGFADFVPIVGATLVSIPIFLVAFFQEPSWIGLSGWPYLLLVVAVFLIIQWVEVQILLPRIVGQSVRLHPLVVLVGLLLGANLAGVLGLLLAAPVIASLRVIGSYIWTKIWDEPPLIETPDRESTATPNDGNP